MSFVPTDTCANAVKTQGRKTLDLRAGRRQTSAAPLQEREKSRLRFAKPKNLSFYSGCSGGAKV